jgi:hypothetical protein
MSTLTETTAVDPFARRMARTLVRGIVAQQIFCMATEALLDYRRAVVFTVPGGAPVAVTATAWDEVAVEFMAQFPDAEIIDGRTL